MDSGAEDRSRLRLHVRAAREWLGRAEESLGRAEDVRGDLNLMLARAELIRARETEHPRESVLWTRRLAPLFVAVLLAGGGYWAWRGATVAPEMPPLPIERQAEPMAPPKPMEAAIPLPRETAPPPAETIFVPPEAESEPEEAAAETPDAPDMAEAAEMPPQETPPAARIPAEDMQRLMNSAGQSLRAIQ